jgi:transposase
MLTREDDVDAHRLHARGSTISAVARHLDHDRKTIRAYLRGDRVSRQALLAEPQRRAGLRRDMRRQLSA